MSTADGWLYDSAAGPLIIALFEFNCYCFDSPGGWPYDSAAGPLIITLFDINYFAPEGCHMGFLVFWGVREFFENVS